MHVLIAEDDRVTGEILARTLQRWHYATTVVSDGAQAWDHLRVSTAPTLAILDWMMPQMDGPEVCRRVRAELPLAHMYLLLVTAREGRGDVIAGLDAGADDYMAKPFALAELSARLRALLRRGTPRESVLRVADLEMDTIRRSVRRAGTSIDLKPKEYALLEFLMRNSDRPLTRSLIIEHVWDIHFDSISNVVEVHINSLRNKIDRGFPIQLIHTVRGVGYMLTDSAP
jgi:two-component system copper resistance phosphate regulon response regulator CusR